MMSDELEPCHHLADYAQERVVVADNGIRHAEIPCACLPNKTTMNYVGHDTTKDVDNYWCRYCGHLAVVFAKHRGGKLQNVAKVHRRQPLNHRPRR